MKDEYEMRYQLLVLICVLTLSIFGSSSAQIQTLPPVPRVSLAVQQTRLSEVLAEFEKQTGITVADKWGKDPKCTVQIKRGLPWEALDQIAASVNGRVARSGPEGELTLSPRTVDEVTPPTSYDGPFRLTLRRLVAARDLDRPIGNYTATLELTWLPTLSPLFVETKPQGLRLVDDRNKTLTVPDGGSVQGVVEGRPSLSFDVPLPGMSREVQKLSQFEGRLAVIAPQRRHTFTFGNLMKLADTKTKGEERQASQEGVMCRIDRVTLAKDRWTIRVIVELPAASKSLDSFQASAWVSENELTLVSNKDKHQLTSSSYVLEDIASRRAVISYHFTDRPGKARGSATDKSIRYRTAGTLIEVPVAFQFRDVPLP